MSDHVKKQASTFDQDFLDTFCSQVDVYTGRDRKMLSVACWIIIGSFEFLSFSFYFYFILPFLLILGWFTGMRPTEQRNILMEDIRPDKTNSGVWIKKTVIKASQGRPAKFVWCIVPYNNKPNCTDYGSIIVS